MNDDPKCSKRQSRARYYVVVGFGCGLLITIATAWGPALFGTVGERRTAPANYWEKQHGNRSGLSHVKLPAWFAREHVKFAITTHILDPYHADLDPRIGEALLIWHGLLLNEFRAEFPEWIEHPPDATVHPDYLWRRDRFGRPFRALYCIQEGELLDGVQLTNRRVSAGIGISPRRSRDGLIDRAVPLGLIPAGFIANTLLYFAGSTVLLVVCCEAYYRVRRQVRTKRGNCPRCAYHVRGVPDASRCPECGEKLDG